MQLLRVLGYSKAHQHATASGTTSTSRTFSLFLQVQGMQESPQFLDSCVLLDSHPLLGVSLAVPRRGRISSAFHWSPSRTASRARHRQPLRGNARTYFSTSGQALLFVEDWNAECRTPSLPTRHRSCLSISPDCTSSQRPDEEDADDSGAGEGGG